MPTPLPSSGARRRGKARGRALRARRAYARFGAPSTTARRAALPVEPHQPPLVTRPDPHTTHSGSRFSATLCHSPRFASQSSNRLRSAESQPSTSFSASSRHQRADDAGHGREHAVALAIAEPFVLVVVEARVARAVAVDSETRRSALRRARRRPRRAARARATHARLTAKRVVKLSVPSSTTSTSPTAASSAASSRRSASTDDFDARDSARQPSLRAASTFNAPTSSGAIEDLPRQIGLVDAIEVVQHEPADAARREIERGRTTEPAQADDQHARAAELRLPFGADVGERDLARVTLAHALTVNASTARSAREIVVRSRDAPTVPRGERDELAPLIGAVLERAASRPGGEMLAAPPSSARYASRPSAPPSSASRGSNVERARRRRRCARTADC